MRRRTSLPSSETCSAWLVGRLARLERLQGRGERVERRGQGGEEDGEGKAHGVRLRSPRGRHLASHARARSARRERDVRPRASARARTGRRARVSRAAAAGRAGRGGGLTVGDRRPSTAGRRRSRSACSRWAPPPRAPARSARRLRDAQRRPLPARRCACRRSRRASSRCTTSSISTCRRCSRAPSVPSAPSRGTALSGRADRVIVISEFVRDRAVARLGLDPARMRVVPLGLDHAQLTPGTAEREPFLLYPARRWPHKNHERLFEAFALAAARAARASARAHRRRRFRRAARGRRGARSRRRGRRSSS